MRNLKNLGSICLMALAMAMPSCENNDNSDELMSGLNGLEKRVEALEALQDQITAIQELLEAAQRNHITSVEEVKDEADNIIGYKINFQDSDPITIYNGGSASGPQITVEDEAGELYWKVNGEWLLDENGSKVPAQGKTPSFKVDPDSGKWLYSFDGTKWIEVEGTPSGSGSGVTVDTENEDFVIFKLEGGTEIQIPWYKPLDIKFSIGNEEAKNNFQIDGISKEYNINYEIEGLNDNDNPIVKAFADNKAYDVKVVKGSENNKGTIEISHTDVIEQGQVTVLVSDGDQRTIMRTITFVSSDSGTTITVTADSYNVSPAGDSNLQIDFESDVQIANLEVVIPDDAKSWITCSAGVETRALTPYKCVLNVSANDTDKSRSATITLRDNTSATVVKPVTITINQASATISVENVTVGGLQAALADKSPETITSLKISGTLNDADLAYLKSLVIKAQPKMEKLNLKDCSFPENKIADSQFNGSSNVLKEIILPDNITTIGQDAFRYLKLTNIIIPSSVTFIKANAFMNNDNLTEVIIEGNPELLTKVFNLKSLTKVIAKGTSPKTISNSYQFVFAKSEGLVDELIVPVGSKQAYEDAGWTKFFTTVTETEN